MRCSGEVLRLQSQQRGIPLVTLLVALTGLLAALLAFALHPLAATLLTLGSMALVLHAAVGVCGWSQELRCDSAKKNRSGRRNMRLQ